MTWIAVPGAPLARGAWIALDQTNAAHVTVLRLREGTAVTAFDGRGGHAEARLTTEHGRVGVSIVAPPTVALEPRWTLVQALPKGDKLDDVVRMATEIGVRAIHLAVSERCIARKSGERAEKQVERLERIAWSAAAQAERAWCPEIVPAASLEAVAARAPASVARLTSSPRSGEPISVLGPHELVHGAWLVVGPEGGLSPNEEASLERAGWRSIALATGILRTETAAAVLLGALVARAG